MNGAVRSGQKDEEKRERGIRVAFPNYASCVGDGWNGLLMLHDNGSNVLFIANVALMNVRRNVKISQRLMTLLPSFF